MFAYCNNNPISYSDHSGRNTQSLYAWLSTMWWICAADLALPIGELIYGLGAVVLFFDYVSTQTETRQTANAVASASDLMDFASTAATPPPPNKGGKGTQVTSKTLYKKGGKNGFRIDVENPGNRPGQIHLQQGNMKYYYNVSTQNFRIGSSTGPLAPNAIQKLLLLPEVIIAIGKGLEILGYGR